MKTALNLSCRDEILDAMPADSIPDGRSGLWSVRRWTSDRHVKYGNAFIPPGTYTALLRMTEATLHTVGETVMDDNPIELRRHLDFVLRAHGRVLVSGLGLGCVLRGLLANPRVQHVDVVERDLDVLRLVWRHIPSDRFEIHQADALRWVRERSDSWDCAWHDLWSDEDAEEPHLAIIHQRLMLALRGRVGRQGAWAFPRHLQRVLRERFPTSMAWAT